MSALPHLSISTSCGDDSPQDIARDKLRGACLFEQVKGSQLDQ